MSNCLCSSADNAQPCGRCCASEARKPHKHAALIKAWADGAEIEVKAINGKTWYDAGCRPNGTIYWSDPLCMFRIKPTPISLGQIAWEGWCAYTNVATLVTDKPSQAWHAAAAAVEKAVLERNK